MPSSSSIAKNNTCTAQNDVDDVSIAIKDIQHWLLEDGKHCESINEFLEKYVSLTQRHTALGDDCFDRVVIVSRVLHPQITGFLWTYENNGIVNNATPIIAKLDKKRGQFHGYYVKEIDPTSTKASTEPFVRMFYYGEKSIRHRWIRDNDNNNSDMKGSPPDDIVEGTTVYELFTNQGYTDYYALPFYYTHSDPRFGISWSTKNQNGFTDNQIRFIDETKSALSLVLHLLLHELTAHQLLCIYLGEDAGCRVHNGTISRGDLIQLKSVIWFADIRNFTKMSSTYSRQEMIDVINTVFEIAEQTISKYDGEILKFIGDGILAVFGDDEDNFKENFESQKLHRSKSIKLACHPASSSSSSSSTREVVTDAIASVSLDKEGEDEDYNEILMPKNDNKRHKLCCINARKAAIDFQKALEILRQERTENNIQPTNIQVGIGLHYGNCSYGNIGATNRLDFTVIGSSVNLCSRVEGLCKVVGASILATENFVNYDSISDDDNNNNNNNCSSNSIVNTENYNNNDNKDISSNNISSKINDGDNAQSQKHDIDEKGSNRKSSSSCCSTHQSNSNNSSSIDADIDNGGGCGSKDDGHHVVPTTPGSWNFVGKHKVKGVTKPISIYKLEASDF